MSYLLLKQGAPCVFNYFVQEIRYIPRGLLFLGCYWCFQERLPAKGSQGKKKEPVRGYFILHIYFVCLLCICIVYPIYQYKFIFLYLMLDKLFYLSVYFLAGTSDLSLGRKFWSSGINGAVHIKLFVTDILSKYLLRSRRMVRSEPGYIAFCMYPRV